MEFITVDSNNAVTSIHHMPFDEVYGLGKTKEELEYEGILVDNITKPEKLEGKEPVMYVNATTNEIYYKYEDIPVKQEDLQIQKITQLEQKLAGLQSAMAELTMMLTPN